MAHTGVQQCGQLPSSATCLGLDIGLGAANVFLQLEKVSGQLDV